MPAAVHFGDPSQTTFREPTHDWPLPLQESPSETYRRRIERKITQRALAVRASNSAVRFLRLRTSAYSRTRPTYRRTQPRSVRYPALLGGLEFYESYGVATPFKRDKIFNELIDLDYLLAALLVGGLASRDKTMVRRFKFLRPDGFVLR
jgi:hypothetical protein